MKLLHITDVWAPAWAWSDSTTRISNQYQQIWIDAEIISAGKSPLHVAFTWLTTLHPQASSSAERVAKILWHKVVPKPIALNCAPRNASTQHADAQEQHIFRLKNASWDTYLIYGEDVLAWALEFLWKNHARIEKILSISDSFGDIIPDTSRWSQFRSAEHLPLVHALEAANLLDEHSMRTPVSLDSLRPVFPENDSSAIVLPPDEFHNGRILIRSTEQQDFMDMRHMSLWSQNIPYISAKSLTEIEPWVLALWPSSNYFPNPDLKVMNFWTRWAPGETSLKDKEIQSIVSSFWEQVGSIVSFSR